MLGKGAEASKKRAVLCLGLAPVGPAAAGAAGASSETLWLSGTFFPI